MEMTRHRGTPISKELWIVEPYTTALPLDLHVRFKYLGTPIAAETIICASRDPLLIVPGLLKSSAPFD